jgi:hypothetical protein
MLPEFLKQVEEKEQWQAKLSALVAAATTATRSKQEGQYNLEKEEGEVTVVEKNSPENVIQLDDLDCHESTLPLIKASRIRKYCRLEEVHT